MTETEYIDPNGDRYMVSKISESFPMPFPNGAPGHARTITARRWVKSRQAFAKHPVAFTIRHWASWTMSALQPESGR